MSAVAVLSHCVADRPLSLWHSAGKRHDVVLRAKRELRLHAVQPGDVEVQLHRGRIPSGTKQVKAITSILEHALDSRGTALMLMRYLSQQHQQYQTMLTDLLTP